MITVRVVGGLGNQMFQYAAALALGRHTGAGIRVDTNAFDVYKARPFYLDKLRIEAEVMKGANEAQPRSRYLQSATNALRRLEMALTRRDVKLRPTGDPVYRERTFHYDPAFFALTPPIVLEGYFQSERYFERIAVELRRQFVTASPLSPSAAQIAAKIDQTHNAVSVHVRRGDYVSSKVTASVHNSVDGDYYQRALRLIRGLLGSNITIFLFSDEPREATALLKIQLTGNVTIVEGDPERPWEDMTLMARCRHHIIANSSFSWWGAWLNPRPEKFVIAPRAWFTLEQLRMRNTCDLHPPSWILV